MSSKISTPHKKLGAWNVRASGVIYQDNTDGFVLAFTDTGASGDLFCTTDISTPPSVDRNRGGAYATERHNLCCPAKKNDYWQITIAVGNAFVYWIPLEP